MQLILHMLIFIVIKKNRYAYDMSINLSNTPPLYKIYIGRVLFLKKSDFSKR